MNTLPKIKAKEIKKANKDPWDFLFLFIDKYYGIIHEDPSKEIMRDFTSSQHTLLAYNSLYGEVCNGGFIQLIQNGYGGYVFNNPLSTELRIWGAGKIADIIDEAKIIYEKYQNELEEEVSLEDFSELYSRITEFEPLETRFYEVMDSETEKIKEYVEAHINDFGVVVE